MNILIGYCFTNIKRKLLIASSFFLILPGLLAANTKNILVFQTDFGQKDGAVSAMYGVAIGVSPELKIYDLTHEIPAYDIWSAAFRLQQTVSYWPKGTVFVSVVDPGVGTDRSSVVLETKSGHFIVSPNNGTLTLIAENLGIADLRVIDLKKNLLPGSEKSYTFHGRDLYAYVGARLASSKITMADVGPRAKDAELITLPYTKPKIVDGVLVGTIPALDLQYGNVWSNIDQATFEKLGVKIGDTLQVEILNEGNSVYKGDIPYVKTFGDVPEGENLLYFNSLLEVSAAVNMGNFSDKYGVGFGNSWEIRIKKK